MRSMFSWYLKPSDEEVRHVWNSGILTVDANVLLDLYRYHESTRRSLLASVEVFNGRVWLSHQAANEFFRNRTAVISSYRRSFNDANAALEGLDKALVSTIEAIRNARIIPEETTFELKSQATKAINEARERIVSAESSHPNYMDSDAILEKIMDVFSGSVGEPFTDAEIKPLIAEAERRIKEKVPPGYADSAKDGQKPYGDFLLWKQILQHAKATSRPIVLVTSDRKEDWWEKHSGKTAGPRYELLKEAHEVAGQRILLYQTDQFVKRAAEYSRVSRDETDSMINAAIEEIRAVDAGRFKGGSAVKSVEQISDVASPQQSRGFLIAELRRPVFTFTASGHFQPPLTGLPHVYATLVSAPDTVPSNRVHARTGTTHDFNIHMRSTQNDALLPAGKYAFFYEAQTPQPKLFDG